MTKWINYLHELKPNFLCVNGASTQRCFCAADFQYDFSLDFLVPS